jgi:hypothetical protein
MARVFVSYRHEDSRGHAGRLYDRLVAEFGDDDVYRDVDKPRPGAAIEERIRSELANCDAFVAVVGPYWESEDPDSWARREIRMAVEQGVPIFVTLVGNLSRDRLPAELAALSVPEVIALPEDYWGEGITRLVREVRASLDAQVLAPHCQEVAQSLASGRLLTVLGAKLNPWSRFTWSPIADEEAPIVELLAELPAILRRKGYDPGLTVFSAGAHSRLEEALQEADEEFRVVEDPYVQQPLLAGSIVDFAAPFEFRPRPSVTLVRLPEPALALDPLEAQLLSPIGADPKPRLESGLSIQLWHSDLLFL